MDKLGTVIHGIGASEHLDSAGERIQISGVDISSLTVDGLINFEHKSEHSSQLIGKIIEATKILKKEDCKNAAHEKFWEKAGKTPYLYIKAVLFDKFGHAGAGDAVAMLKFDQALKESDDTRQVSGFSVEGSRLYKDGSLIKKCIARKISFTVYPCNKACVTEILEPTSEEEDKKKAGPGKLITLAELKAAFKKAEEIETDMMKAEGKYNTALGFKNKPMQQSSTRDYTKISQSHGEHKPGSSWKPQTTMPSTSVTPKTKLNNTRITYDKPKGMTGKAIYNNPDTWKAEFDSMSNSRKAMIKKIKLDKSNSTSNIKTLSMSEKMSKRKELLKSISEEAFNDFPHKDELIKSIKSTRPKASEKEVMAIAKTYAYVQLKKSEIAMAQLADESSLNEDE